MIQTPHPPTPKGHSVQTFCMTKTQFHTTRDNVAQPMMESPNIVRSLGFFLSLFSTLDNHSPTPQKKSKGRCRSRRPPWRSKRGGWSSASPWWIHRATATPSTAKTGAFVCLVRGRGSKNISGKRVLSYPYLLSSNPFLNFILDSVSTNPPPRFVHTTDVAVVLH